MGFIYDINLNCQGNLPKTKFLTSWLRQQSELQGNRERVYDLGAGNPPRKKVRFSGCVDLCIDVFLEVQNKRYS